jgi:hypothetical protein
MVYLHLWQPGKNTMICDADFLLLQPADKLDLKEAAMS